MILCFLNWKKLEHYTYLGRYINFIRQLQLHSQIPCFPRELFYTLACILLLNFSASVV